MKKVILIAACLLSLTTVNAQQDMSSGNSTTKPSHARATPEQRAQKNVDALSADVSLTEDQKPKVYALALAKVKKTDEIKAKYKGDEKNEAKNTEMRAAKKEFHDGIKGILTPEQVEKLKTAQKSRSDKGSGGDGE